MIGGEHTPKLRVVAAVGSEDEREDLDCLPRLHKESSAMRYPSLPGLIRAVNQSIMIGLVTPPSHALITCAVNPG